MGKTCVGLRLKMQQYIEKPPRCARRETDYSSAGLAGREASRRAASLPG